MFHDLSLNDSRVTTFSAQSFLNLEDNDSCCCILCKNWMNEKFAFTTHKSVNIRRISVKVYQFKHHQEQVTTAQ